MKKEYKNEYVPIKPSPCRRSCLTFAGVSKRSYNAICCHPLGRLTCMSKLSTHSASLPHQSFACTEMYVLKRRDSMKRRVRGWTKDALPRRSDAIVQFGVPWLEDFADPAKLIGLSERAIERSSSIESLLEQRRNPDFQWPTWIKTIYQSPASPPRPAPMYFHLLSLLYQATGDFEKGCDRAQVWLDHVSDGRTPREPARTLRLMGKMGCKQKRTSTQ